VSHAEHFQNQALAKLAVRNDHDCVRRADIFLPNLRSLPVAWQQAVWGADALAKTRAEAFEANAA
jgi:hypothetical protein